MEEIKADVPCPDRTTSELLSGTSLVNSFSATFLFIYPAAFRSCVRM